MGARYLKAEEEAIQNKYPIATKEEILMLIPNRTWEEIGNHARKMGIHRTTQSWGNSVREGRKAHKDAWNDQQNALFDRLYPTQTYAQLLAAFPNRTLISLRSHAEKRHLHRSREATGRQMNIGREDVKRKNETI